MRTNPRPTLDTIGFYYPDHYGPYQGTGVKMRTIERNDLPSWKRLVQKIFQFNNMRFPALRPGRMLEIGCASGAFMHQMAQKGWDVGGVESSSYAASNASALGYPVHAGPLETAPNPQQPYDLVVGWMVLEHLHDPILALKKIYGWTKPGGWLILSVPNAGSFEFFFLKNCWYGLHLPNHLFHFTPRTIRNVLSFAGWEIVKIHHQRVLYNLIPSVGYALSDAGLNNGFVRELINFPENAGKKNYFLYPLAYILASIGQTGRMTIWAKRNQ
jgi:SAM-dependent methyltransferase